MMDPYETAVPKSASSNAWLIIFADVLALLLTFFVLLFSMNSVQVEGWQAVVSTFTERLNPSRPETTETPDPDAKAAKIYRPRALDLDYLSNVIDIKVRDHPVLNKIIVSRFENRLVVSIPTELLFEPGSSVIAPSFMGLAGEIGELFRTVGNGISVAGHAQLPPAEEGSERSSEFANHWDLSLARAIAIARIIRKVGYRRQISAFGHGAERFGLTRAVAPMSGDIGFVQRVDIVVENARSKGVFSW